MDKGRTQSNRPKYKKVHNYAQGFRSKRYYWQIICDKKRRRKIFTITEEWIDASVEKCAKKSKERLITAASNNNGNIRPNRKKKKSEEKSLYEYFKRQIGEKIMKGLIKGNIKKEIESLSIAAPWCNSYRRCKWTRRYEFKSWTRLIAFHIALIPLGNVWIQLFSLQLWVNRRTDWVLQPWLGN